MQTNRVINIEYYILNGKTGKEKLKIAGTSWREAE
jgi:hypothetical protein